MRCIFVLKPAMALGFLASAAMAQDAATPEELAVRAASPGIVASDVPGEFTIIELELQGCRIVQTLLTTAGRSTGGPVGVQVLRMDLRDLDPITGILPAEDTSTGNRRAMLIPSQGAWEQIQAAGDVFSRLRQGATEEGDTENPNAVDGTRTLRTQAQRGFSADAASGVYGPVMARTHVMQMRGDRGALIYPLIAPMQITLAPDTAQAALAVMNDLRGGQCAPEDGIVPAPVEGGTDDAE
jgi:hypothetical protein